MTKYYKLIVVRQRWWKLKLHHDPSIPKVYSSDLAISRKTSLLYLTGYPSHDLFSIDLEELRSDKDSLTVRDSLLYSGI